MPPRPRILVISDCYPSNEAGGLEYALDGQVRALRDDFDIELLLAPGDDVDRLRFERLAGRDFNRGILISRARGDWRLVRALKELTLREPYFLLAPPCVSRLRSSLGARRYDAVFAYPARMVAWATAVARLYSAPPPLICSINDAITEGYRQHLDQARLPIGARGRLREFALGFRSLYFRALEARLLRGMQLVVVQTRRDMAALAAACGARFGDRVVVCTNGFKPELLKAQYEGARRFRLLYFGTVDRNTRDRLLWFVKHVFVPLRNAEPRARLDVAGNCDKEAAAHLRAISGVHVLGRVEDIGATMGACTILVAPNFMRVGLLNKVMDAMAAGLPCVGVGAFNGLEGFASGVHGFAVETASEMRATLERLLNNPDLLSQVSRNARQLVRAYAWEATTADLRRRVRELIERPSWNNQQPGCRTKRCAG